MEKTLMHCKLEIMNRTGKLHNRYLTLCASNQSERNSKINKWFKNFYSYSYTLISISEV